VAQALSRQGIGPDQSSSYYNTGSCSLTLRPAFNSQQVYMKKAGCEAGFLFFPGKVTTEPVPERLSDVNVVFVGQTIFT